MLSEQEVQQMREMKAQGMTDAEMADILCVTKGAIYLRRKKMPVQLETDRPQDVVVVTRCKDCKHWSEDWCNLVDRFMQLTGYCSCGKRGEENAID